MYAEANPWVESYLTEARREGIGPPEEKEPNDEKEGSPTKHATAGTKDCRLGFNCTTSVNGTNTTTVVSSNTTTTTVVANSTNTTR